MTVSSEVIAEINKTLKLANPEQNLDPTTLTSDYCLDDLEALIWFVNDFLANANGRGVKSYHKHIAFKKPSEIKLLAEIFADPEGKYQDGNPPEFLTCLKATPEQIPVYLHHMPGDDVWRFSTHPVYKDQDITTPITLKEMFV